MPLAAPHKLDEEIALLYKVPLLLHLISIETAYKQCEYFRGETVWRKWSARHVPARDLFRHQESSGVRPRIQISLHVYRTVARANRIFTGFKSCGDACDRTRRADKHRDKWRISGTREKRRAQTSRAFASVCLKAAPFPCHGIVSESLMTSTILCQSILERSFFPFRYSFLCLKVVGTNPIRGADYLTSDQVDRLFTHIDDTV